MRGEELGSKPARKLQEEAERRPESKGSHKASLAYQAITLHRRAGARKKRHANTPISGGRTAAKMSRRCLQEKSSKEKLLIYKTTEHSRKEISARRGMPTASAGEPKKSK